MSKAASAGELNGRETSVTRTGGSQDFGFGSPGTPDFGRGERTDGPHSQRRSSTVILRNGGKRTQTRKKRRVGHLRMTGTFRGSTRWRSQWSGCEKHTGGCGDGRTSLPQAMASAAYQHSRGSNWSGFLRKVVKVRRFTSCMAGDGTACLRAGGIDSTTLLCSFGREGPFGLRAERGFARGRSCRGRGQRLRTMKSSDGWM